MSDFQTKEKGVVAAAVIFHRSREEKREENDTDERGRKMKENCVTTERREKGLSEEHGIFQIHFLLLLPFAMHYSQAGNVNAKVHEIAV